jgi:hypothetical protein
MLGGLGAFFRNDAGERTRKEYQDRVNQINALEPDMQRLSDEQLRQLTDSLKARAAGGESLDQLLVESFAVSACVCISRNAPCAGGSTGAALESSGKPRPPGGLPHCFHIVGNFPGCRYPDLRSPAAFPFLEP